MVLKEKFTFGNTEPNKFNAVVFLSKVVKVKAIYGEKLVLKMVIDNLYA